MSKKIYPETHYNFALKPFILNILKEDIGNGDYTSISCIPANTQGSAQLLVKQNGIIAGVELAQKIFRTVDKSLKINIKINDGEKVSPVGVVLIVTGNVRSILAAERVVLNCMQRMSGIATYTHKLVEKCAGTKAKIIDTMI